MPDLTFQSHPTYFNQIEEWLKWRLTYSGGHAFIMRYLKPFSRRESPEDFIKRRDISYVPAFAKADVNEIKNSIFQRMTAISRIGGPQSYAVCMAGNNGGVDAEMTDMNTFIGQKILPELLVMRRVGVYVDMPKMVAVTRADIPAQPYIYSYKTEDIINWQFHTIANRREYRAVILRDYSYDADPTSDLPMGMVKETYRHLWIDAKDGKVHCKFTKDTVENLEGQEEVILPLTRIPFCTAEISESLLQDVANYQIALLNIASSDLAYALTSNFPFYTEQDDGLNFPSHLREESPSPDDGGTAKNREITVGPAQGRTYKKDPPKFINPSSEPLEVSMKKQQQMKDEIRELINLALSNVKPKMASAESKGMDERGLESGLSSIGLELQRMERMIAEFWSEYEGEAPAVVNYPAKYMLKTDEDRRKEAKELADRLKDTPSLTYKKELCKKIARITLEGSVSEETLQEIEQEIDKCTAIITDDTLLTTNLENGVLCLATAAIAQGFKADEPVKAAKDHADRLARIQESQSKQLGEPNLENLQARGIPDLAGDKTGGKDEKKTAADPTTKGQPKDIGRGKA